MAIYIDRYGNKIDAGSGVGISTYDSDATWSANDLILKDDIIYRANTDKSTNYSEFVVGTDSDQFTQISGDTYSYINLRQAGSLTLITGTARWYAPRDLTISEIIGRLDTASSGSSVTVVIKKNGATMATLTFGVGVTKVVDTTINSLNEDDYLTVDVTAIGSSVSGSDLNLSFKYS